MQEEAINPGFKAAQGFVPDADQAAAIARGSDPSCKTLAVTGPAGTGKTTILRQIHDALLLKGFRPAVCAPTGKAAKRIQEATGIPAMTIHRLLEFTHPGETNPETGQPEGESRPRRTGENRLEFNAILCDEYAMVPWYLHRALMAAMPHNSVLRTFGDCNQLAPIEDDASMKDKPSPFQKMLNEFAGVWLNTIHRQGEGSGIAKNGFKILNGSTPMRHDDFWIKIEADPLQGMMNYVIEEKENGVSFAVMDNQIITPTARTTFGARALNQLLQSYYMDDNTGRPWMDVPRWSKEDKKLRMFEGDKVICTSNNYDLGVFNGETGVIKKIDSEFGLLLIDFGDKVVEFPPVMPFYKGPRMFHFDPRKTIDLAYCVTTHKSQGSEYKHVLYVMGPGSGRLRSRRNFYTGITRARTKCAVIADDRSFSYALWNTRDNFD